MQKLVGLFDKIRRILYSKLKVTCIYVFIYVYNVITGCRANFLVFFSLFYYSDDNNYGARFFFSFLNYVETDTS